MSSGNVLFFLMMLLGPLVSLSSSNWIVCWGGIELGFLSMIPLLLGTSSTLSKECTIKYFCVQALSSGILMLGGVMLYMNNAEGNWLAQGIFMTSIFMKLGVFPMHFWVPSVSAGLDWLPLFILLVWQKVAPFAFLMNVVSTSGNPFMNDLVLLFGGLSALVGSIIGLNQTSLRAMLGSSSIVHTGWGCLGVVCGGLWTYFSIYAFSFAILMAFCLSKMETLVGVSLMGLSGLPPFMTFIGKWMLLKSVLSSGLILALFLPIVGAFISLFFYLKFFYSFYLKNKNLGESKYYLETSLVILPGFGMGIYCMF